MISPIEENGDFRGFADVANIRKPKQDRGALQPIAAETLSNVSPELEAALEKIQPGFKQWRAGKLAQVQEESDPNPTGPPNRVPGLDTQDNPGVNLRDQFPEIATESLGTRATGPEIANRVRKLRFFGR